MEMIKKKSTGERFHILGFLENFVVIAKYKTGEMSKVGYNDFVEEYVVRRFF